MTARLFVDTNVLVYSFDQKEPEKQRLAQDWLDRLWSARAGRISFQVLQELYVTVTRNWSPVWTPRPLVKWSVRSGRGSRSPLMNGAS